MDGVLVDRRLLEKWARAFEVGGENDLSAEIREVLNRPAGMDGRGPLDEILALYPLQIERQSFVVNGGNPITVDGEDEFLSVKKVDAALGKIRRLAEQGRTIIQATVHQRNRLQEQVRVLQSDANSWQSGYNKGRADGTKHRQSEVQQLPAEVEALRKDAERYRWLRNHGFEHATVDLGTDCGGDNFVAYRITLRLPEPAHSRYEDDEWEAADIDAAIDAAIKATQEGESQ